jgi:hypothetical protein
MATLSKFRKLLLTAGTAGIGCAAAILLSRNIVTLASARATVADASPLLLEANFPICQPSGTTAVPNMLLRLTQTREVPRGEMSIATSAPAFADTAPPLWPGLGSLTYTITTANERAQAYFDQGLRLAYAFNHADARHQA